MFKLYLKLLPVNYSGEGYRRKREDVELFERTVHRENIYGNNIYPHPSRKEYSSIEELEPRRIYRGYPEVEKIRISKEIRKEMGLPLRDPPTEPSGKRKIRKQVLFKEKLKYIAVFNIIYRLGPWNCLEMG